MGQAQIAMGWEGNGTDKYVPWTTLEIALIAPWLRTYQQMRLLGMFSEFINETSVREFSNSYKRHVSR